MSSFPPSVRSKESRNYLGNTVYTSSILSRSTYLVVLGTVLAVVTNDLEAADHLTNGEETKTLGSHNTASNQLGRVDVAELLQHGRGLLRSLRGGLRESAGVSNGVQHVLVVALEGLHGTMINVSHTAMSRYPRI